ncbi:HD domain-containing protein [Yoonia sp. SS1-5]|uniref:HD domain-containing protein n=1 Tax=Yoonia rhodophyticola TaxID=3137370 RepID=A0AAN0MM60_9RHOB
MPPLTPDDRAAALALATKAHAGQTDKTGVDYMVHVRAVAAGVQDRALVYQITALLHDTVEDCDDPELVSLAIIGARFGDTVRDAVDAITKRKGERYKEEYLARVRANPVARAVKLADIAHNKSRLRNLQAADRERLSAKYDMALHYLADD